MLLYLKVKNYRSFKEEQEISFVLNKDERSDKSRRFEVKTKLGTIRVLKNAMIYGANASGKSNILKALFQLSALILNPNQNDEQGLFSDSFASNKENTRFEVVFLKHESIFKYILEYNRNEVVFELLQQDDELIFERNYQEFVFSDINAQVNYLVATIRKTSLALFFAQNNNVKAARIAFSWFYDLQNPNSGNVFQKLRDDSNFKERVLYAMRFADFNIFDIEIEENLRPSLSFGMKIDMKEAKGAENFQQQLTMQNVTEIYLVHENNGKSFRILLQNESEGTQQYFNMILLLLGGNSMKDIVILNDEFDRSLHKKLTQSFVNLINSEKNNIQFISTTHDSSLMDILQKHQIYFVEKNSDGESEIYKLSEFDGIRKETKISPKYEAGLFGAIQEVNEAGLMGILEED
ncbi:AAA family ATPase [Lactococcus petauri]|uniref:AAA family ATPase n=1 Tax=Lactococcus petauri TaxID=1940789 RepID=UPI00178206FB|nr:ATP-binding protein [Lactococcus petauri]MBD5823477.1 ATP-binding protein [Lactococcus petauri]